MPTLHSIWKKYIVQNKVVVFPDIKTKRMLLKRVWCARVCYARFVKLGTDIKALGRNYRKMQEGKIVETSNFCQ